MQFTFDSIIQKLKDIKVLYCICKHIIHYVIINKKYRILNIFKYK